MIFLARTRARLVVAGAVATVMAVAASVSATPLGSASAAALEVDIRGQEFQSSYGGYWAAGLVSGVATPLTIQLPTELAALDVPGVYSYRVSIDGAESRGVAVASGRSVMVPMPASPRDAHIQISLHSQYDAPTSAASDAASIVVSLTSSGSSSNASTVDLDAMAPVFVDRADYSLLDRPVRDVSPGDVLSLRAEPGFWERGSANAWDPSTTSGSSAIVHYGAESSSVRPTVESRTAGGAMLSITVPRPHWAFVAGEETIVDFAVVSDDGVTRHAIHVEMPIAFRGASTPHVERVFGADRFAVSQQIARAAHPDGAGTVFITNGLNFPDALSASPAAAQLGSPLLLTTPWELPPDLAETITQDMRADTVVIVGGPNSVSAAVEQELAALDGVSNVRRLGGVDRFAASIALADYAFGESGASRAYIATGLAFPDALSAGAAGGASGSPVILVNPSSASVGSDVIDLLIALGVDDVVVAGGPNSVPERFVDELESEALDVRRIGGADRFHASSAIARDGFPQSDRVFLATGLTFPDALAGAAWAASDGSPLIVIPGNCVPPRVLTDIRGYQATEVIVLGGPNSVAVSAESLTPCGGFGW